MAGRVLKDGTEKEEAESQEAKEGSKKEQQEIGGMGQ
jgi:hypothetical protein